MEMPNFMRGIMTSLVEIYKPLASRLYGSLVRRVFLVYFDQTSLRINQETADTTFVDGLRVAVCTLA